jgi:N-acetylated-alpha-linked acidic dipeptidase
MPKESSPPANRRAPAAAALGAMAIMLLAFAVAAGRAQDSAADTGITGFAPARVSAERELEQKLRAIPDAARAGENLRRLTSEPHMSGTEASHRVAEWLRDQYRSFGFDTDIVIYSAWLPMPREITLEITKPVAQKLATAEPPIDADKDTADKRITPAFNRYSPSGEATAAVVYVNYGMQDDYHTLAAAGINVEGKILLARYGKGYRGVKAKLAEDHKAAALILYSDPKDDGATQGDTFPNGPWRPLTGIQRGSIIYTQIYPGDPLTPGTPATANAKRLDPADAPTLPRIPTMPINAQDAAVILGNLGGDPVPPEWQGALPMTYHFGPGASEVHMKLVMDYQLRPVYNVIARLRGTSPDEWVILGNHHDAWVYGAADPGSGTASMLETARALGELVRGGWKPRRTILMCHWDGEEPGLIGSTEWVEANGAELQAHAVAYLNTDVGVTGPNFGAGATPSLKNLIRDATREVEDPRTGGTVYAAWREHGMAEKNDLPGTARQSAVADSSGEAPVDAIGSGSDYSAFFDHAGIPSVDIGFNGPYGVYHSAYDDFYWMKHFGDPKFAYHATLAKILGTMALRLDEADVLPFDYRAYALELEHLTTDRIRRATRDEDEQSLEPALDGIARLSISANNAAHALDAISAEPLDPAKGAPINHALASVEQAFLVPEGLVGRPWFKHPLYAPGTYTGYAAVALPGVTEALDRGDSATLKREADALAASYARAAAKLDEVTKLAEAAAKSQAGQ